MAHYGINSTLRQLALCVVLGCMRSQGNFWFLVTRHPSVPPPEGDPGGFHPPGPPQVAFSYTVVRQQDTPGRARICPVHSLGAKPAKPGWRLGQAWRAASWQRTIRLMADFA